VFTGTVVGSSQVRNLRAVTIRSDGSLGASRYKVRARRTTLKDTSFNGQVQDEVQWHDLYAMTRITQANFGNVTTVQAVTIATEKATSVSDRQLNMLVTRKVPAYNSSTNTFGNTHATSDAGEILMAICRDPYIGNRSDSEIDFAQIRSTVDDVVAYFGIADAGQFCYTFDNVNMSFEETVQNICTAVFCVPYRMGHLIQIKFEKQSPNSVLLFNHRNKIPGTEQRTVTFGNHSDYDYVEYQYVSPTDDAVVTLYVPDTRGVNALRIQSIGVRSQWQAYFHAWREWQKIRYQNTMVEFDATQESQILINTDRVLVADNTRGETVDGEVISQSGLVLTLSQPFTPNVNTQYEIMLQGIDGLCDTIPISQGPTNMSVVLSRAPTVTLSLDEEAYARSTYWIVDASDTRTQSFLVTERTPNDTFVNRIKAVNYSDKYYAYDKDYINGAQLDPTDGHVTIQPVTGGRGNSA
jgi:hypothetical protein